MGKPVSELWEILPQAVDLSKLGVGMAGTFGSMGFLNIYKDFIDNGNGKELMTVVCYEMPSENSNFISFDGELEDCLLRMIGWCIKNDFLSVSE